MGYHMTSLIQIIVIANTDPEKEMRLMTSETCLRVMRALCVFWILSHIYISIFVTQLVI